MEKNKKPVGSFLEPKYSLLRSLQAFCNGFNSNANEEDKQFPIIFTQSYMITGEIIPYSPLTEENAPNLYASKLIFEDSFKLPNKIFDGKNSNEYMPKVLLLKDVTITSLHGGSKTTLPSFNLFVDQVVGFTFGHIESIS